MKKILNIILSIILCLCLLIQSNPAAAAGSSGSGKNSKESASGKPTETASSQPTATPTNEPTYKTQYKVKKIKNPPYCITVNGNEYEDFSTQPWNAGAETQINIIGQREEKDIAGEWQFYVTFKIRIMGDANIQEVEGGLQMGMEAQLDGTGKGDMTDLVEKKKKEKEEKEKEWQPVFPSDTPKPKQTPIHTDADTIRNSQEAAKELYQTEFDVELAGTIQNIGQSTVYGQIGKGDQWYSVDANFLPDNTNIKTSGKVKLTIDSNNNVIAYLTSDGKTYGPYAGVFTCEEDLDIQRKDSGTWPIWGVWTDVNPYEAMPAIVKDVETVNEQLKNKEEPKKIQYPEGRWVMLKQGKKDEAATYTTLQVSAEDITLETGEIWPYPGSAMFKPESRTVYSKDLQKVLKSDKPMDYEQVITYHTANDTIMYPGFGNLVRVRNSDILGIWSSKGELPMPDPDGSSDAPEGIWYEFTRGGKDLENEVQKGYSAAYKFTRIISGKDKSLEIDKGTAIMMPVGDENLVILTDIKSEKITKDGEKTKTVKESETLSVSGFDKKAGKVKFSLAEYTLVPGLPLKGGWSTMDPAIAPPDVANGAFLSRDENGNTVEPSNDAQWIQFIGKDKTFVWTQMLENPDGILVITGNFRTFGKDLLLLTDIKGSFYPRPGTDVQGFTDQVYMYGEKLFQIEQKNDEDKNPISLTVDGEAEFYPIPEGK